MNRAEFLVKISLDALGDFLGEQFGETVQQDYKDVLENWNVAWDVIRKVLIETPFTDRNTTVLNVIEHYFPCYHKSFRSHIEASLSLHHNFWDRFFLNMKEAKNQITAT